MSRVGVTRRHLRGCHDLRIFGTRPVWEGTAQYDYVVQAMAICVRTARGGTVMVQIQFKFKFKKSSQSYSRRGEIINGTR